MFLNSNFISFIKRKIATTKT